MKHNLWDLPKLRPEEKICSFEEAAGIANPGGVRANGVAFILVPGVFDIIHPGHLNYFRGASKYGQVIAGLESDESVRLNKGPERPVNSIDERMLVIASLQWASLVCELPDAPRYSDANAVDTYIDRLRILNPLFVAIPEQDPNEPQKRYQAREAGVIPVMIPGFLDNNSTTQMLQKVGYEG